MLCVPSEDSDPPGHHLDRASIHGIWIAENLKLLHTDSKDSDQTGRMPWLI